MLEVRIENLTFPSEVVELIELRRNDRIRIHLSDPTVGDYHEKFRKWINLSGTYDTKTIEYVSIGKHVFEGKFTISCKPSIGIPGRTADNIEFELVPVPKKGL
ncbi:MAG: hypothetical protein ACE1YX_00385 [Nitrosopumilaceae archaeon]